MSEETKVKHNWGLIIGDMIKLMCIVGCVGVVCKFGIAMFERVSPSEDLISIVNKNNMTEQGVNNDFLAEIANGKKSDPDFINCRDGNSITPLMWACYANFNDAKRDEQKDIERFYYVEYLLSQPDLDYKAKDNTGLTALHWAAWSGLTHCSALLIEKGLDINEPESKGYTPLMLAALRGNVDEVRMLLALGADVRAKNKAGLTAYDLAVKNHESYKQRATWVYKLIYSESRDNGHAECVTILANPAAEAAQTIEEFLSVYRKEQASYLAEFAKKKKTQTDDEVVTETSEESPLDKYAPLWKVIAVVFGLPIFALIMVRFAKSSPVETV